MLGTPLQLEAILCDVCMHLAWLWGHLSPTGIPSTFSAAELALVSNIAIISALTVAAPQVSSLGLGTGGTRDTVSGWAAEPGRTQHPGSFFVVDPAVGCLAKSLSPLPLHPDCALVLPMQTSNDSMNLEQGQYLILCGDPAVHACMCVSRLMSN